MFEYLKGLELPDFGLDNWQSSIRKYARMHPDYSDIDGVIDWNSIADIEYHDREGQLTDFLVKKGHLLHHLWANERPHYHFEVKTTTSADWQEPFFMSKYQRRHVSLPESFFMPLR